MTNNKKPKSENGKKKPRKFGFSWNFKNKKGNNNRKNNKKNNGNNKKNKKKIDFKYNIKEYWSFLSKHKKPFLLLLFFILVSEFTSIADKYLFKVIIDKGTNFSSGILSSSAFVSILLIVAGVYALFKLTQTFSDWLIVHFIAIVETNLMRDIKQKYFNHILHLDHKFHTEHKTGSLISRVNRGSSAAERLTDTISFSVLPLILQIILVGGSLIYFDPTSAIILLIVSIVFIIYGVTIQNRQQFSHLKLNKTEDIEKANIADVFTNIDSIKYFGKEKQIKKKFKNLSGNTRDSLRKYINYYRWFDAGQTLIISTGIFLLIYFPLKGFLAGNITLGTITFIYTVSGNVIHRMFSFVHSIRDFYRSMGDFQELFEYGKVKKEITDKSNAKNLKIKGGDIEFNKITFGYSDYDTLFKNFSLKIPKNKNVALVGQSGCGKSTLLKLLYRLYDVQGGSITVDGEDIRELKQESLRSEMSIVPQEPILFDDTIYNNVKFSNSKASRKEVMNAIKFAQLDRIINKLPKKENTIVGERGVKLSGGEKQRVSIARALLADKKVLVLDEATSALDSETEHEIQKDLYKLMEGRTSIIIAHRLSTIMHADIIVVMKNGKIVQKGNHRELITKGGEYQRLWDLQKGGYVE